MKWAYVKNSGTADYYTLLNNNIPVLEMKYNHHTDTARVNYKEEKRAFMIHRNDDIKNRVCLQNEYGFNIGFLAYENLSEHEGIVEMENEKYRFTVGSYTPPKFSVYNESSITPLASVEIARGTSIPDSTNNRLFEKSFLHAALLLVLCWYLYLPVKSGVPVLES